LRKRGHSKEGRDNDPQVIVGLAVTREGLPRVCGHWAYLAPFDAGGLLMLLGLLVPEGSF
jgi:hypothetical protein